MSAARADCESTSSAAAPAVASAKSRRILDRLLCDRQFNRYNSPLPDGARNRDGAAVHFGDRSRVGEPQSRTLMLPFERGAESMEWLEHGLKMLGADSDPSVGDPNRNAFPLDSTRYGNP